MAGDGGPRAHGDWDDPIGHHSPSAKHTHRQSLLIRPKLAGRGAGHCIWTMGRTGQSFGPRSNDGQKRAAFIKICHLPGKGWWPGVGKSKRA